jgi:hypothetical protein
MSSTLLLGIIAVATALLGCAIAGLFTYIAVRRKREFDRRTNDDPTNKAG